MTTRIIITIDVEDWFQVENLKGCIPFSTWEGRELRVERNTNLLLDFFDAFGEKLSDTSTNSGKVSATFFVLGWIAEKLPHLVRKISDRGHEIASHGYFHSLCTGQTFKDIKEELIRSKKFLEDITGAPVFGYRAPSFSISDEILDLIRQCGYFYDSSYNSFCVHERYGRLSVCAMEKTGVAYRIGENFFELPVSNLELGRLVLPWAGGGYFRLIPLPIFKHGVREILKKHGTYVFYMHPWEIDPGQPRIDELPRSFRFRHYLNLERTFSKLRSFLTAFAKCEFTSCKEYLDSVSVLSL